MTEPRVSVVLPVRNRERYVGMAITSVLRQTLADFELIVVDDGSSDGTARAVASAAAADGRVKVSTQPPLGFARALKTGLALARAPYVARMDSDDIALPERLERQAAYLDAHAHVVAVGGQIVCIDGEGRFLRRAAYPTSPRACRAHLAMASPFCHPAVMFRALAVTRAGGYRGAFAPAEDLDLWLRLAAFGEFANLAQPVLRYRLHEGSDSVTMSDKQARRSALAALDAAYPDQYDVMALAKIDDWALIEEALAPDHRLAARGAYLRFAALNGGVVAPPRFALLMNSLPLLACHARETGSASVLGFTVVRGMASLARAGRKAAALRLFAASLGHVPVSVLIELSRALCALFGRTVFRA